MHRKPKCRRICGGLPAPRGSSWRGGGVSICIYIYIEMIVYTSIFIYIYMYVYVLGVGFGVLGFRKIRV